MTQNAKMDVKQQTILRRNIKFHLSRMFHKLKKETTKINLGSTWNWQDSYPQALEIQTDKLSTIKEA